MPKFCSITGKKAVNPVFYYDCRECKEPMYICLNNLKAYSHVAVNLTCRNISCLTKHEREYTTGVLGVDGIYETICSEGEDIFYSHEKSFNKKDSAMNLIKHINSCEECLVPLAPVTKEKKLPSIKIEKEFPPLISKSFADAAKAGTTISPEKTSASPLPISELHKVLQIKSFEIPIERVADPAILDIPTCNELRKFSQDQLHTLLKRVQRILTEF